MKFLIAFALVGFQSNINKDEFQLMVPVYSVASDPVPISRNLFNIAMVDVPSKPIAAKTTAKVVTEKPKQQIVEQTPVQQFVQSPIQTPVQQFVQSPIQTPVQQFPQQHINNSYHPVATNYPANYSHSYPVNNGSAYPISGSNVIPWTGNYSNSGSFINSLNGNCGFR